MKCRLMLCFFVSYCLNASFDREPTQRRVPLLYTYYGADVATLILEASGIMNRLLIQIERDCSDEPVIMRYYSQINHLSIRMEEIRNLILSRSPQEDPLAITDSHA